MREGNFRKDGRSSSLSDAEEAADQMKHSSSEHELHIRELADEVVDEYLSIWTATRYCLRDVGGA